MASQHLRLAFCLVRPVYVCLINAMLLSHWAPSDILLWRQLHILLNIIFIYFFQILSNRWVLWYHHCSAFEVTPHVIFEEMNSWSDIMNDMWHVKWHVNGTCRYDICITGSYNLVLSFWGKSFCNIIMILLSFMDFESGPRYLQKIGHWCFQEKNQFKHIIGIYIIPHKSRILERFFAAVSVSNDTWRLLYEGKVFSYYSFPTPCII